MAPQLSPNDRERIISLKLSGHKIAEINRLTGITRQTIHLWLRRWEEYGDITAHRRQIYQRATTAPQDEDIIAAHAADPHLSPKTMSAKYRISVNTVRRRLKEASRKMQQQSQSQVIRYDNDGLNITPIVSLNEESPAVQKDKLNNCIQTHIYGLNDQFIRVTNLLSQEVTKNNLSVIKRLEKVLGSIETPAQARSFAVAKIQSTKKKKNKPQPKAVIRHKDMTIRKSIRTQSGRPDTSEITTIRTSD